MTGRLSEFQLGLLISAATVIAYLSTFQNDFVDFDDGMYVTENAFVQQGLTAASVRYAFMSLDTFNYTPVTLLVYEIQVALFGLDPWMMHATNLAFHLANSLLLFRLLRLITNAIYRSALVAFFFAIHPLHVESVAWISELKDVLSTFFLLLVLLTYQRYSQRPTWKTYLSTLGLFALGLLSKSMLVTTPILLCILDVWMLDRWKTPEKDAIKTAESVPARQKTVARAVVPSNYSRKSLIGLLLEKLPFFMLSLLIGVITVLAQAENGAMESYKVLPLEYRIGNMLNSFGWYLLKTACPWGLCVFYPHPYRTLHFSAVLQGAGLICALSLWVVWGSRDRKTLAFGWLWFLVALLPVIGLVQVGTQAYADRYAYVPHIGLLVMIVWESHFWLMRLPQPWLWNWGLTLAAGLSLMGLTSFQVASWKNTESLWKHAIAVDTTNFAAYRALAGLRLKEGNLEEALSLLEMAVKNKPDDSRVNNDLGYAYQLHGEASKAEVHLLRAIELDPLNDQANYNLVSLYRNQKRYEQAIEFLRKLAEKTPLNSLTLHKLAGIYWEAGEFDAAEQTFEQAIRIQPNDVRLLQDFRELQKERHALAKPHNR